MMQGTCWCVVAAVLSCGALLHGQVAAEETLEGKTLLDSHWHQAMPYSACTPDHQLLGCHSLAYAQILAYHRLAPHGHVEFKTSTGYKIDEDLDANRFDLDHFPAKVTDETSHEIADQVARYCYLVSAVCQKDYGTDQYLVKFHTRAIAEHFDCDTKVLYPIGPGAMQRFRQTIMDEIEALGVRCISTTTEAAAMHTRW